MSRLIGFLPAVSGISNGVLDVNLKPTLLRSESSADSLRNYAISEYGRKATHGEGSEHARDGDVSSYLQESGSSESGLGSRIGSRLGDMPELDQSQATVPDDVLKAYIDQSQAFLAEMQKVGSDERTIAAGMATKISFLADRKRLQNRDAIVHDVNSAKGTAEDAFDKSVEAQGQGACLSTLRAALAEAQAEDKLILTGKGLELSGRGASTIGSSTSLIETYSESSTESASTTAAAVSSKRILKKVVAHLSHQYGVQRSHHKKLNGTVFLGEGFFPARSSLVQTTADSPVTPYLQEVRDREQALLRMPTATEASRMELASLATQRRELEDQEARIRKNKLMKGMVGRLISFVESSDVRHSTALTGDVVSELVETMYQNVDSMISDVEQIVNSTTHMGGVTSNLMTTLGNYDPGAQTYVMQTSSFVEIAPATQQAAPTSQAAQKAPQSAFSLLEITLAESTTKEVQSKVPYLLGLLTGGMIMLGGAGTASFFIQAPPVKEE